MPSLFSGVVLCIAAPFFFFVLPAYRPYPYVDDWIYVLPLQFTSLSQWVTWTFEPWGDHRIPIQKVTNFLILKAAGFDYRYIVGLNYMMAVGLTGMLLYIAKAYRGRLIVGDLIIPLLVLHYAHTFTNHAFHFEFLSSVFFFVMFLLLGVRYAETGRRGFLSAAAVALLAESWTGLNGLIPATIATVAVLAWVLYYEAPRLRGATVPITLLIAVLLVDATLWLSWTPSPTASPGNFRLHEFALYMRGLVIGSTGLFSFEHAAWKFVVFISLFVAAMTICLQRFLKRTIDIQDALLAVGAAASFAVLASIAIGRSKLYGEWQPQIGLNYGFLSVLIPLLSWIVLSKFLPYSAREIIGFALVVIFLASFKENADWKFALLTPTAERHAEVISALQSGADPQSLNKKYGADFMMSNDVNSVAGGIRALRAAGFTLYGGHN